MILLERLSIPYHVIVNKSELVPVAERGAVKAQIRRELDELNPRFCRGVFYVSANDTTDASLDWDALVRAMA